MADLIAIGYQNEATAEAAADEARRLARDLIIEPEAIAVIVCDSEGKYHVHTSHNPVGMGATWGACARMRAAASPSITARIPTPTPTSTSTPTSASSTNVRGPQLRERRARFGAGRRSSELDQGGGPERSSSRSRGAGAFSATGNSRPGKNNARHDGQRTS